MNAIAIPQQFTDHEWQSLTRFLAGEPARNIRQDCPDIWGLVARFRALPAEVFKTKLEELRS